MNKAKEFLSRYMSFPKLIDMIKKDDEGNTVLKIPFTRLDVQSDPIEGVMNLENFVEAVEQYQEYKNTVEDDGGEIIDEEATKDVFSPNKDLIEGIKELRSKTFISCWVNHNKENLPMWNLYAGKQGVMISVSKQNFIDSLTAEDSDIQNGCVKYGLKFKELDQAPFHKNKYYKYENEYRFMYQPNGKVDDVLTFKKISVTDELLATVKTHPEVPDWIKLNYKDLLKSYNNVKISSSEHETVFKDVKQLLV